VVLFKSLPGRWDHLFEEDLRGEQLFDSEQLAELNEQLSMYTSDIVNSCDESNQAPFNTEQLEECDALPEEDTSIWSVDGESHEILQQVNLSGHQFLFHSLSSTAEQYPVICLRHDVDGIIWQPTDNSSLKAGNANELTWHHVSTFSALGYVQASKQQRKFITCSPDFSYSVIADYSRHIYVYRQPVRIPSPIRNRTTGERIEAIAKQHLISLQSTDNILGLYANQNKIFVLCATTLYAISVVE